MYVKKSTDLDDSNWLKKYVAEAPDPIPGIRKYAPSMIPRGLQFYIGMKYLA